MDEYHTLLDQAPLGIVAIDQAGVFRYINQKFKALFGYDLKDLPNGKEWFRKAYPDPVCRDRVIATWIEDMEDAEPGEKKSRIFSVTCIDGSEKTINFMTTVLDPGLSRTARYLMFCQDITEHRRMEEMLREKEGTLSAILNAMTDVVFLIDLKGTILTVNDQARKTWQSDRDLVGSKIGNFLPPEAFETNKRLSSEVIRAGKAIRFEFHYQGMWIENSLCPIHDGEGKVTKMAVFCRDVTDRKRANEELETYREHLEDLVRERTERIQDLENQRVEIEKIASSGLMAARIAHEINNPLAGIKNSFLLIKDAVPKDHPYYDYVGRIEKEINRTARIVRQMFDLYHPDQEMKNEFLIDKTIFDVVALLEAALRENSVTMEVEGESIMMESSEESLRQILYNLLLNAIEASPRGGIVTIVTEVEGEALILSISDQGAGIPSEARSHIFEPFFTTKHGCKSGLGLGLSISREIVGKLGGQIGFESETGKRTVFRITVPIKNGGKGGRHGASGTNPDR
jgi:two-component system, sporulation sensor kinase C